MKIKILITGGTIDKIYDDLKGELTFDKTHVPAMLEQGRCNVDINIETLMLKDSLDMVEQDRMLILERCQACKEKRIIITHGTDTMTETAEVLGQRIKDKKIVLLGAMIPYSFDNSDSMFNLGCAITAVQSISNGVYITMNGKIFTWDKVLKNKDKGIFQTR